MVFTFVTCIACAPENAISSERCTICDSDDAKGIVRIRTDDPCYVGSMTSASSHMRTAEWKTKETELN